MHTPSWAVGDFACDNLLFGDLDDEFGYLRRMWTPQGMRLNPGPGLTGTDELVSPKEFEPNLVDPFVFMTAGFNVALGPVTATQSDNRANKLDPTRAADDPNACIFNGDLAIAERQFIVFFNPCLVWGARMDLNT